MARWTPALIAALAVLGVALIAAPALAQEPVSAEVQLLADALREAQSGGGFSLEALASQAGVTVTGGAGILGLVWRWVTTRAEKIQKQADGLEARFKSQETNLAALARVVPDLHSGNKQLQAIASQSAVALAEVLKAVANLQVENRDCALQVRDLHGWHDVVDSDGVRAWYVPRSLEKTISELSAAALQQATSTGTLVTAINHQTQAFREMVRELRSK